MRKYIIVLDKSELAHNIYEMVLPSHFQLEEARHLEDIDVLLREHRYDLLIMNANTYSPERWTAVLRRNPTLNIMPKILITRGDVDIDGFQVLKRPFNPKELLEMASKII